MPDTPVRARAGRGLVRMITVGSVSRDAAAERFGLLAEHYRGRRTAIRAFTHAVPEFVFWIHPDGTLFDARDAHRKNVPRGYEHIVDDEPDYGGFLRGRLVRSVDGFQVVVVYCRAEALAAAGGPLSQLLAGLSRLPLPLDHDALVVSDNADVYGTVADLLNRAADGRPADRASPARPPAPAVSPRPSPPSPPPGSGRP